MIFHLQIRLRCNRDMTSENLEAIRHAEFSVSIHPFVYVRFTELGDLKIGELPKLDRLVARAGHHHHAVLAELQVGDSPAVALQILHLASIRFMVH